MRKAQKQQAEELVKQMEEAHDQIKKFIEQGSIPSAMELLEECQNGGITLGTLIENTEGEGHPTVLLLEEYCELAYQVHEDLTGRKDINANKIYKLLRQKLIRVSNSIKNDVHIRIEVAFFPYKASMWDSLESVYLAAREDSECDAYCVPIPYYDMNPDHSFGKMHYEGNEYPEDIEITDWQEYNFEKRKPDVIYIHNPYDDCNLVTSVHPRFYSSNLKKYTDTLVYIPYYSTSGGMSKAQSLCPAYIYADYIVIQSSEFRKYFDANIPDQKFLPFGSPKFDRIIKKCQNPPEPLAEWKEKMAGKKVCFYNTSISGMLSDTEAFLKKMNYVFECFEGREDVCLLWRPHPLLEATFDSMRPQYRHVYDDLKQMFLDKGLGILDTTPDIADAVALSDAYIGEAGTSVTSLFGVAGKPIFILDSHIHEKPRKDSWRGKIGVGFDFQEQDRFTIAQGNKLYISEPDQYNYQYFCDLSINCLREYYTILQINGKMYAYPLSAQNILVIGNSGVERRIELQKELTDGQMFFWGWKFDRFLILHPLNYPALVRLDTTTEECLYVKENIDVYVKEKEGRKITGSSFIYQGNLYLASPTDNRICKFDISSGKMQIIEIPIKNRCGCCELIEYMDEMWMLPYAGKVITRWNPKTGRAIEYTGFPDGFRCARPTDGEICEEMAFTSMAFYDNYVYFAPKNANMFLRLDVRTGQISPWKILLEEELEENRISNSSFLHWNPKGDCLKIFSNVKQRLYQINMKTDAWEEIEIKFDRQELEENAAGFGEWSETLTYVCLESVFNSLDRFLTGEIVDKSFDRDRQLQIYGKIIANINGNCGRQVYEYIKARG